MQQTGCFNIWELIASSTLPAALLHTCVKQQVDAMLWVPTVSSTSS